MTIRRDGDGALVQRGMRGLALLAAVVFLAGCGASLGNNPTSLGSNANSETNDGIDNASDRVKTRVKASKAARELTKSADPTAQGYKIGPEDLIEVTVFKVPELSKAAQVSAQGSVNLPLLGEQQIAGMTAQEAERKLTKLYGAKYLQNPQISVYVKESNSQRVTLEGAVKKPGVYPLRAPTTLLQMIATAQGLQEDAESTVIIFRQVNGKRQVAKFDIDAIRKGDKKDPAVQAGDVIIADRSASKAAFKNVLKALPLVGVFAGLI